MFTSEHTSNFPGLHKPSLTCSAGTWTWGTSVWSVPWAGWGKVSSSRRCTMQHLVSVRWYFHMLSQSFVICRGFLWVPTNVLSHKMGFLWSYPLFTALVNFIFQIWKFHFLHRNRAFCYCALLSAHFLSIVNLLCVFAFPTVSVSAPFSHQVLTKKGKWVYNKTALQDSVSLESGFHALPNLWKRAKISGAGDNMKRKLKPFSGVFWSSTALIHCCMNYSVTTARQDSFPLLSCSPWVVNLEDGGKNTLSAGLGNTDSR